MSLPPSAATLLDILATRGPLTHKQLVEISPLPDRTLRFGLRRLRESGYIRERPNFRDLRQAYYQVEAAPPVASAPMLAEA